MAQYTELKQRYCDAMGSQLGQVFHHLMQEAAFLHLKWNEYIRLFGASAEQMDLLTARRPDSSGWSTIHGGTACCFTSHV